MQIGRPGSLRALAALSVCLGCSSGGGGTSDTSGGAVTGGGSSGGNRGSGTSTRSTGRSGSSSGGGGTTGSRGMGGSSGSGSGSGSTGLGSSGASSGGGATTGGTGGTTGGAGSTGGGGTSGNAGRLMGLPVAATSVSGRVYGGPVSGAQLQIYLLDMTSWRTSTSLGSGPTDASGAFDVSIPQTTGYLYLTVSGGQYVAESDGTTLTRYGPLSAIAPTGEDVTVTPISMLTAEILLLSTPSGSGVDAVNALSQVYDNFFGLWGYPTSYVPDYQTLATAISTGGSCLSGTPCGQIYQNLDTGITLGTLPPHPPNPGDAVQLAYDLAALDEDLLNEAAITQCQNGSTLPPADRDVLYQAILLDLTDGRFDGYYTTSAGSQPVTVSANGTTCTEVFTMMSTDLLTNAGQVRLQPAWVIQNPFQ